MFCLLQSGGYEIWECLHMKENTDDWHYSQTGHDWVKISPLISEEEGLQMFSLSLVLGYRISVISSQEVLILYCCDIEMCRSEFVPPPGPTLSPLLSIENWQERLKYPELRYCLTNIYSSSQLPAGGPHKVLSANTDKNLTEQTLESSRGWPPWLSVWSPLPPQSLPLSPGTEHNQITTLPTLLQHGPNYD